MKDHKENLAAGQAFLTILLLAGTILVALVYTAAIYVGAGLMIVGVGVSIFMLARHGETAKAEPQPIMLRVEKPQEPEHRRAA